MVTSPPLGPNVCGSKETGDTKNDIMSPAIELSERQRLVLEMNKQSVRSPSRVPVSEFNYFKVLPCSAPLNTNDLRQQYVEALQSKKVHLTGLANAEQKCGQLEKVLVPLLGDAEMKGLFHAYCNIERLNTVKSRYMKAVASIKLKTFCLSSKDQLK